MSSLSEIREAAENDLLFFIRLLHPNRVLGTVHEDIIKFWTNPKAKSHQLVLIPRDHQKSWLMAMRVAWEITKNPCLTVLYNSATAYLCQRQLSIIKSTLESKKYLKYWPEHVHTDPGKRELWNKDEILLDHPLRKKSSIKEPTVLAAGLTTNITGLHFGVIVLDDIVVVDNAYTEEGRRQVESRYSLLASIETTDSCEWTVGTRYYPNDIYSKMLDMKYEVLDKQGKLLKEETVYEVFQGVVEDQGDGNGQFLWPKTIGPDGRYYGFDQEILAKKKAQYLDKTQFFSQYYNNPNASENSRIDRDKFQYYNKESLKCREGDWFINNKFLKTFAAIDFAFSRHKKADYTCLSVIGVDSDYNIFILELDRFRTDEIAKYYDSIFKAYNKWGFKKINAEVTVAQQAIVKELKERFRQNGVIGLKIEEYRPTRQDGHKWERIASILEPLYEDKRIYHYRGGNCELLEQELIMNHPPSDDIKDSLSCAVLISSSPSKEMNSNVVSLPFKYNSRFGGIR